MKPGTAFWSLAALGALMACSLPQGEPSQPSPGSRSAISAQELSSVNQSATVLEAIEALRPVYLRGRCSRDDSRRITVMVDGLVAGGVEVLEDLRVGTVRSVEQVCASDVMQRFGSRVSGSVIVIATGRWN
jgi:hypothetical protein